MEGRNGAVAVGLSLDTGTCVINHVVCGKWGWCKGPGSVPPMLRGDVITSVDGQMVVAGNVGQLLHAGTLGSRVQIKALRGNLHTTVEATLVRQDGLIVDGLVHVEEVCVYIYINIFIYIYIYLYMNIYTYTYIYI